MEEYLPETLDEILEAIVDGKSVDWSRIEEEGTYTKDELWALKAIEDARLIERDALEPRTFTETVSTDGPEKNKSPDPRAQSEKIFLELLNRLRSVDAVKPEDYLRKFPDLEKELSALFRHINESINRELNLNNNKTFEGQVWGDYRIIKRIGKGGMATVFEAEQVSLKRRVALKIFPHHLSLSDEAVKKFYREAEAGGRQKHPGIVSIHAVGEHEGIHYIIQELVEDGYTLAARIDELNTTGELPIGYFRDSTKLVSEVADALAHAHASGVIHRDVKPSNILIIRNGTPKLTDFGMAKIEDALTLSRTGDFSGTPYYMSPEQVLGLHKEIDARTDVFSLGVTLYETLTLKRPFDAGTSHEVLKKIIQSDPVDPRKLNPRLPRDLAVICQKSMEKEPKSRYQSMAEFGEDLRRYLQGEVILAKPSGFMRKSWKRVKRNPLISLAIAVALFAVIFTLVVVPWVVVEKEKEKSAAIQAEAEKTRAINEFMQRMFASPDPGEDGREIRVVDVLDKAVGDLEGAFPEWPEVEASLRNTIGNTYYGLGQFEDAFTQYHAAMELFRDLYGETNSETLEAMTLIAKAYWAMSDFSKSEEYIRKVFEIRMENLGEEDPKTLSTMNNLALVLTRKGDFAEAESIYRSFMKIGPGILGEQHYVMCACVPNFAGVLKRQGKYEEAEKMYNKAIKTFRRDYGPDHPLTLDMRRSASGIKMLRLEYENHVKEIEQLMDSYHRVLGEEHPDTLKLKIDLACSLTGLKRYNEADELLNEVFEIQSNNLGEEHTDTLITGYNISVSLFDQGKVAECEPIMRKVYETQVRLLGNDHYETIRSASTFGALLTRIEKYDEAESVFIAGLQGACKSLPPEHFLTAMIRRNYGILLHQLDRDLEAEEHLEAGYKYLKEILGEDNQQTKFALEALVEVYKRLNRTEKLNILRERLQSSGE